MKKTMKRLMRPSALWMILPGLLMLSGCTEPYAIKTTSFESAIVIEATITNELKQQQVKISRTYRVEDEGPEFETGAQVWLSDDQGATISFSQQDTMYVSDVAFSPDPSLRYQLHVTTADGHSYISTEETLTSPTPIESLNPVVTTMGDKTGVQICVNAYDPAGTSRYYRYEYEESGKIIAPYWSENELLREPDGPDADSFDDLVLQPRTEEAQICYSKHSSDKLVLTNTTALSEDRVVNFPIRYIGDDEYLIANRYGIKVRQFVMNLAAYTYYKTLADLNGSGSLLSQNQPGFFYGNIRSETDASEKVIGYFELSSVSEQTLFFNFNEIFPNTIPPFWPYECTERHLNQNDWAYTPHYRGDAHTILNLLSADTMTFYTWDENGWFVLVTKRCGDCRETGSNIPPDFWQD